MTLPVTARGWVQLAAAAAALVATVGGTGWAFVQTNAWSYQLHEVETYAAEGIKTATCTALDFKIEDLQREKADSPGEWSGSDEAYLQRLLRRWEQYCVEGS